MFGGGDNVSKAGNQQVTCPQLKKICDNPALNEDKKTKCKEYYNANCLSETSENPDTPKTDTQPPADQETAKQESQKQVPTKQYLKQLFLGSWDYIGHKIAFSLLGPPKDQIKKAKASLKAADTKLNEFDKCGEMSKNHIDQCKDNLETCTNECEEHFLQKAAVEFESAQDDCPDCFDDELWVSENAAKTFNEFQTKAQNVDKEKTSLEKTKEPEPAEQEPEPPPAEDNSTSQHSKTDGAKKHPKKVNGSDPFADSI